MLAMRIHCYVSLLSWDIISIVLHSYSFCHYWNLACKVRDQVPKGKEYIIVGQDSAGKIERVYGRACMKGTYISSPSMQDPFHITYLAAQQRYGSPGIISHLLSSLLQSKSSHFPISSLPFSNAFLQTLSIPPSILWPTAVQSTSCNLLTLLCSSLFHLSFAVAHNPASTSLATGGGSSG